MKAVLMSIHHRWVKEIFVTKRKTIEVRKTYPKLDRPFIVYVYQTKHKGGKAIINEVLNSVYSGGKVIGSFVCNGIIRPNDSLRIMAGQSLLTENELLEYSHGKELFGWRITEPKLFDKPKELSEFYIPCKWYEKGNGCPEDCDIFDYEGGIDYSDDFCQGKRPIKRPPQSWFYVESYRDHTGDHDTHYGI